MKRLAFFIVLFAAGLATAGLASASHQGPVYWLHCEGLPVVCSEEAPPTSTITETDTVTTTVTETVTEPPTTTTTTEPDPPSSECLVSEWANWQWQDCSYETLIELTDAAWNCTQPLSSYGPLPIKVVIHTTRMINTGGAGLVNADRSCTGQPGGRVDLILDIEGDGLTRGSGHDAFKTRNAGSGSPPTNLEVTGRLECGPLAAGAHQDDIQYQAPGTNVDLVNVRSGNWQAGTATCANGGGSPIYTASPPNSDIRGSLFVGCNHGILGQPGAGSVIADSGWRTGRIDGSDPRCASVANSSPPCSTSWPLQNVVCQRWDPAADVWRDQ